MTSITQENYESIHLDEWQVGFFELYGEGDRNMPLYDMMLQIVVDSTRLAEAMRRDQYDDALNFLPRLFSWQCALVSKCSRDPDLKTSSQLSDVIWKKYPGVCCFCAERHCRCPGLNVDSMSNETRKQWKIENQIEATLQRARIQNTRPTSLNDWFQMVEDIYGNVNAGRSSAEKTFHYLEEVGEVEIELRRADRIHHGRTEPKPVELESEIADNFTWLSAIYLHIEGSLRRSAALLRSRTAARPEGHDPVMPRFANWVWNVFGDDAVGALRCHRCGKTRCACEAIIPRR